ncbi:MAG: DUF6352 family protein [Burkholderiales bacterium]
MRAWSRPLPEFWRNCGYFLLERDAAGRLTVTDDFLRAYLGRPEVAPIEESCDAERRLHAALMDDPRRAVADAEIDAMRDDDTRHNYRMVLRLRDRLVAAGTVEGCYLGLFQVGVDLPPIFIEQLVHVILRNILDDCSDPLQLRAAELFWREQKATMRDGHVLLADLETVEMHAAGSRYGNLGRLIVEAQGEIGKVDLDVLDRENAQIYWERESRHDTVVSLTYGGAALDALCRVMEAWIAHFHGLKVTLRPLRAIDEARWAWHIGLDAESTAILNELWSGEEVDAGRMRHVVALFSLQFADASAMRPEVAGRTVYLALSMGEDEQVRLKPQNLLLNLPIRDTRQ